MADPHHCNPSRPRVASGPGLWDRGDHILTQCPPLSLRVTAKSRLTVGDVIPLANKFLPGATVCQALLQEPSGNPRLAVDGQ